MTATQAISLSEEIHALNQRIDQLMYVIHELSSSVQSHTSTAMIQRELLAPQLLHPHKPTIELAA